MKYYLISVGGTGARCLEAFVHMNAVGFMKDLSEIKIIYVDPDASNGNLNKAKEAVVAYANAFTDSAQKENFFKNKLTSDSSTWNPVPMGSHASLFNIFNRSNMDIDCANLDCLFDILFSKEEQNTKLTEGFRAHPSIGAAVIGDKMNMTEEKTVWKDMADDIGEGQARIFFFGSVFGGTGAAGFPNIARIIRKYFDDKNIDSKNPGASMGKNSNVRIGGCLMLPYFDFTAPNEADKVDEEQNEIIVPDSGKFKASTYAALNYYKASSLLCKDPDRRKADGTKDDIDSVYDAVYLLGDQHMVSAGAYHAGQKEQKNKAHYIEMLAALSAFDFFNKEEKDEAFKDSKCYMMAISGKQLKFTDLPAPYPGCNVEAKMKTFIRTIYMYRSMVYPKLKECYSDKAGDIYKENPWVDPFFYEIREVRSAKTFFMKKELPVAFISDDNYKKLETFWKYSVNFLDWLKDISYCDVPEAIRGDGLVNKDIFNYDDKKSYADNLNDSEVHRVVRPEFVFDDNANSQFDSNESSFLQQLVREADEEAPKGIKPLLETVYDLCKDGKEVE